MSTDNMSHGSPDSTKVEYASADTEPEFGDAYAGSYETTEGRVYTVAGGDWDTVTGVAL